MRTLLTVATILAVTGQYAYAQGDYGRNERLEKIYEEQARRQKEDEKGYNDAMKHLRAKEDTKAKNDPWQVVRPIENNNLR